MFINSYIKINNCALCREPLNKKVCNELFRDILNASGKTKTQPKPKRLAFKKPCSLPSTLIYP